MEPITCAATPARRATEAPSTGDDALARYDHNRNGLNKCKEARRHGIAPVRRAHPVYQYMRASRQTPTESSCPNLSPQVICPSGQKSCWYTTGTTRTIATAFRGADSDGQVVGWRFSLWRQWTRFWFARWWWTLWRRRTFEWWKGTGRMAVDHGQSVRWWSQQRAASALICARDAVPRAASNRPPSRPRGPCVVL